MSDFTEVDTEETWLSYDDLATVRGRVPMVYVDAVPVRVDSIGEVTHIGLLLTLARLIFGCIHDLFGKINDPGLSLTVTFHTTNCFILLSPLI